MKQCKLVDKDTFLLDVLNAFYAQFEQNTTGVATHAPTALDTPVPSVTASDVRSVFLGVNPRKAMGPDSLPSQALRSCVDQLVEVFTDIFNLYPYQLIKKGGEHAPIYVKGTEVERVKNIKFLG
eukprot:g47756.t1